MEDQIRKELDWLLENNDELRALEDPIEIRKYLDLYLIRNYTRTDEYTIARKHINN